MGVLTVTLGLNQHVSGLGITLFATGLALFAFRLLYGGATSPPALDQAFPQIALFTGTPLEPVFSQYALTYLALLLVPVIGWMLYRTAFGLAPARRRRKPRSGRHRRDQRLRHALSSR